MKDQNKKNKIEDLPISKRQYHDELLALFQSKTNANELKEALADYHEGDIADIVEQLSLKDRQMLYNALDEDQVSEVFSYLENVEEFIDDLPTSKVADIIENMDADDAVDILDELDEDKKAEIIKLMESDSVKDIELIDSYDDDQIGSMMTTNFVFVNKNCSIKEATSSVIKQASENDNINNIYALNDDNTFYGAINLSQLIIARENDVLDDIISTSFPYLKADESIEDCLEDIKDYEEHSLPVLNKNNKLLGIITLADIVETIADELHDDYAKFAGLTEAEDLKEGLFTSMKKRIPWLVALLCLGILVSTVIQQFQTLLPSSLIILYTFQSLILGMSGNTGTQSLGVTLRVINDESLKDKYKFKFVLKELRVGFFNSLVIGTISLLAIGFYITFVTGVPSQVGIPSYGFAVAICISLSLVVAMVMSSFVGTITPMFFKKIGIDPAVASGPLISTVNDFIAVCAYYGLSLLLFVQLGIFAYPQ